MAQMKWYHTALLGSGVAAGLTLLLYYLFQDDSKSTKDSTPRALEALETTMEDDKLDVNHATRDQVMQILNAVYDSQITMKALIRSLTQEFSNKEYTFEEVYKRVHETLPEDPLEKRGISMAEFDLLIGLYTDDININNAVGRIMIPSPNEDAAARAAQIDQHEVIEMHKSMVEHLKVLVKQFSSFPNYENYEMKSVTIAIQIISAIEVEKRFKRNMDEVEMATLMHHDSLAENPEFALTTCEMQVIMSEIIGNRSTAAWR